MIRLKHLLNEAKIKPYEKLLINSVIQFMKNRYGFNSKIIVRKKEKQGFYGDISLSHNSVNNDKFYLHYNPGQGFPMIIQSLIHELTHVKQVSKKELQPGPLWKTLFWKGKEYISVKDYNKLMKSGNASAYKKLPWEAEAYSNQKKLYKQYLSSSEYKSLKGKDKNLDYIIDNMY